MSFAERAHQQYRAGQHEEALKLYTEALAHASFNFQKIALHSNMAACYLKLRNLKKAAEECSSVLELDQKHVGALMLRVHILVALKDYHSALFDVHRLMEITPSSEMYRSLEARLRTQLQSLAPIPEGEEEPSVSEAEMENTTSATEKSHTPSPSSQNTRKKSSASKSSTLVPSSHCSAELTKTGWDSIPKPRGHSGLDYSRWDQVETDSSGDEEEEDPQPQYLFCVRAVGVRPIK